MLINVQKGENKFASSPPHRTAAKSLLHLQEGCQTSSSPSQLRGSVCSPSLDSSPLRWPRLPFYNQDLSQVLKAGQTIFISLSALAEKKRSKQMHVGKKVTDSKYANDDTLILWSYRKSNSYCCEMRFSHLGGLGLCFSYLQIPLQGPCARSPPRPQPPS